MSNVRIEILDKDHAKSTSLLSLYHYVTTEPAEKDVKTPALITKFIDEFVRTKDGWRIKTHVQSRVRL